MVNRTEEEFITKEIKCPSCGNKVVITEYKGDCHVNNRTNTYSMTKFCEKCHEFITVYIDVDTEKEYIGHKAFYKQFPGEYDLKKYLQFLVKRLDWLGMASKEILDNEIITSPELKEFIKNCIGVANFRSINTFSFIDELLIDMKDEKYCIDIKKVDGDVNGK